MGLMFWGAKSFKQNLCGAAWVHSRANKQAMFTESPGSISQRECASTVTRQYLTRRRPVTERGLKKVRTPTSTSVSTGTLAITATNNKMGCAQCGTFSKSGRVSCCAPGGAWYKRCGGVGNRNADHRWFDGTKTCKRMFKANANDIESSHRANRDCFHICALFCLMSTYTC